MKNRIDNILVNRGYFETRQKAKYAIENKGVYVNDILVEKSSKNFEEDCKIEVKEEILPFVSRGGLKLDKAIKVFNINLKSKVCIDIGASTGGFTDCMLQNGASKVFSIDVGHDQLAEKLKEDKRVINLEGTNIREIDVKKIEKADFISIDVSFISLTNVLDKTYELLKDKAEIMVLIKPQFEAGKEFINKNGVVKDKKVHTRVIEKIVLYANSLGFKISKLDYSPIKGPAGNIEYIMYMEKSSNSKIDLFSIREIIKKVVDKSHKEL